MGDINFRLQLPDKVVAHVMRHFDKEFSLLKSYHAEPSIFLKGDESLIRSSYSVMLAYYEMLSDSADSDGVVEINRLPLLSITEHDLVPFHYKGLLIGRNEWTGYVNYALEVMPVVFIFDVNFELLEGNNLLSKFMFELNGIVRKRGWRGRKTIVTTASTTGMTTKHVAGIQEYFKFIDLNKI